MTSAIKIENLSKQYRLGLVGTGSLIDDLDRWWHLIRGKEDPFLTVGETNDRTTKGNSNYVWALKNINFEVEDGDVVGIIGKNGAGKSTLLKILSKVTSPTTGKITYCGRIGSLLEVGTGFSPELTGRENIYLNGAILGMRKREIDRKLDEIIDFSGCERYIDTPVKRYSSGMTVRLGFAVAAFLEPEILIVDEVLAVGDAEFQKKAIGKMQDVSKNDGKTVLFVSHNMGAVKNLCKTGILMANGQIKIQDNIDSVLYEYLKNEKSDSEVTFNGIIKSVSAKQVSNTIELRAQYSSPVPISQPNIGFVIYDIYNNPITGTNPLKDGILEFGNPKKDGEVVVTMESPWLIDGNYNISIWFNDGKGDLLFFKENCIGLKVTQMATYTYRGNGEGYVYPKCKWEFN